MLSTCCCTCNCYSFTRVVRVCAALLGPLRGRNSCCLWFWLSWSLVFHCGMARQIAPLPPTPSQTSLEPRPYSLPRPQSAHRGPLDLVPSQEHHPQGLSPSRCSQRRGRRGIQDHERSFRLDALQGNTQDNSNTVWTPGHRFVCVETDETTSDLCQLVARPTGSGDRRVLNELERSEGIRQPPLALDQLSFMLSQGAGGNHCAGGAGVEKAKLGIPYCWSC